MSQAIRGSCLCQAIAYEMTGKTSPIGQCHCSKCRKVSGTNGNSVLYCPAGGFRWVKGEDLLHAYVVPESNGWASTFCSRCGCPMPALHPNGKFYFVPAGSLDDDPGHRGYAAHIFVDSKAPWVVITDDAPQYAEGFESKRLS